MWSWESGNWSTVCPCSRSSWSIVTSAGLFLLPTLSLTQVHTPRLQYQIQRFLFPVRRIFLFNLPYVRTHRLVEHYYDNTNSVRCKVMKQQNKIVPSKLGLPPKFISCSSSIGPNTCTALPWFKETGGVCFFSLLHLKRIAIKVLPVIAIMKEDNIIRSATQEGVFSFETTFSDGAANFSEGSFFSTGTKTWLRLMRKITNNMEVIPTSAAIQIKLSSPFTA